MVSIYQIPSPLWSIKTTDFCYLYPDHPQICVLSCDLGRMSKYRGFTCSERLRDRMKQRHLNAPCATVPQAHPAKRRLCSGGVPRS